MKQFTQFQAFKIRRSEAWKKIPPDGIVKLQLWQEYRLMPFEIFQLSMTSVLNRVVEAKELIDLDDIRIEYLKGSEPPTFEEIMDLLPPTVRRNLIF